MEKRLFRRKVICLPGTISIGSGLAGSSAIDTSNRWSCQIQDFCNGGIMVQLDGKSDETSSAIYQKLKAALKIELACEAEGVEYLLAVKTTRQCAEKIGLSFIDADFEFIKALSNMDFKRSADQSISEAASANGGAPLSLGEDQVELLGQLANVVDIFIRSRLAEFIEKIKLLADDPIIWQTSERPTALKSVLQNIAIVDAPIKEAIVDKIVLFWKQCLSGSFGEVAESTAEEEQSFSLDGLSLVEKDDFEEWLQFRTMAAPFESEFSAELQALHTRMEVFLGIPFSLEDNVVSPGNMLSHLDESLSEHGLDFEAMNAIFGCYRDTILTQLIELYKDMNFVLSKGGVLPGKALREHLSDVVSHAIDSQKTLDIQEPSSNFPSEEPNLADIDISNSALHEDSFSVASDIQMVDSPLGEAKGSMPSVLDDKSLVPLEKISLDAPLQSDVGESALSAPIDTPAPNFGMPPAEPHTYCNFSSAQMSAMNAFESAKKLMMLNMVVSSSASHIRSGERGISSSALLAPAPIQGEAASVNVLLEETFIFQCQLANSGEFNLENMDTLLTDFMSDRCGNTFAWDSSQLQALALARQLILHLVRDNQLLPFMVEKLSLFSLLLFRALLSNSDILVDVEQPVAQLINTMVSIGMKGCLLGHQQKQVLVDFINHLLTHFKHDISVFAPYVDILNEIKDAQEKKFEQNSQRLLEICDGEFKIIAMKQKVDASIDVIFGGKPTPKIVVQLVENGWRDLMYLCLLKEDQSKKAWQLCLSLLEDLSKFISSSKILVDVLKVHPDKMLELIEKGFHRVKKPQTSKIQQEILEKLKSLLNRETMLTPLDFVEWRPAGQIESGDRIHLNMSKVSNQNNLNQSSLEKWKKRVHDLSVGSWLGFSSVPDGRVSGRLLWKAPDSSRLVFVNRQGLKVFDSSLEDLSVKMQTGEVLLLTVDELPLIEQGLNKLVQSVYSELSQVAQCDDLTGLGTRKELEKALIKPLNKVHSGGREFFILYVRVQYLASVNSICGYEAGDLLIKTVVDTLFSQVDLLKDVIVSRVEGTDFAFVLQNCYEEQVQVAGEQLLALLLDFRFEWNEALYSIGASIGLLQVNDQYQSQTSILHDAQSACIAAARAGGNRLQVFTPAAHMFDAQRNILRLANKVDDLIDKNAIRLKAHKMEPIGQSGGEEPLKPIYEILLGTIDDTAISIQDFVCTLERFNRMSRVDCWVIKTAFKWMEENPELIDTLQALSINLSGCSLNDNKVLDYILEIFSTSQVPCDKVCFEITETVAIDQLNDTVDFMKEMKNMGCLFAMDDFGAGMSSYSYLKYLPVDYLKIDGSFVRDMKTNRHDLAMVKSITEMGHHLGKKIVAEFVQDQVTVDYLKEMGVEYAQGFFIEKHLWLDQWPSR